jgi:hypothetical protein
MTTTPTPDVPAESERSAATPRRCGLCGKSIEDLRPQARYCSDACRARGGRQDRDRRVANLLDTIIRAADDLRRELGIPDAHASTEAPEYGTRHDG